MRNTKKNEYNDNRMIFLGEDRVLDEVIYRKQIIQSCLKDLEQRIQVAPEGSVRISLSRNRIQYYHRVDAKDRQGIYLKEGDRLIAEQLARKAFFLKMQKALKKQLKVLNIVEDCYNPSLISDLYENLSEERKRLINPVVMSDREYAAWWLSQEYEGKGFRDDAPEYYTNAGERVRSKSEIIIADKLSTYGIPYRYEYPIITESGIVLYPDFYCLNIRRRKKIIWEHFGMMDDPDYAENAIEKLNLYSSEGFILGKNLIATFETRSTPLNTKLLEENIKMYLL